MKNLIKFLLLMMAVLLPATVSAYDFEVNGIYYNINGNEATVTYHYDQYNYGEEYGEEYYDFYGDYSGDVTIPNFVTYNGTIYPVTTIGNCAFYQCKDLTNVTIPNTVTTIGSSAFQSCWSLNNITIPSSVTRIEGGAFWECSNLTSIIIPNSVTYIGGMALVMCYKLTSVSLPNSLTSISDGLLSGCTNLTDVFIPNSITSIGDYAFSECESLISITIPNSVTSIGYNVFANCNNLTTISVDSGNTTYDSRNNCNGIIKTASNTLIAGCSSTIIPNTVTTIDDHAFEFNSSLTSISIPNSVTHIGNNAFSGCGLTNIVLPNSVKHIGDQAFSFSSLTNVTIPNSTTYIGKQAFDCWELIEVYSRITEPATVIMEDYFGYGYVFGHPYNISQRTLYVPIGTLDAYQADSRWSDYFGNIVEMEIVIPATAIELDVSEIEVTTGEILQLRAIVLPEDATNKAVTWASSDANIARVDGNGLVTALAPGSTTITATTVDGSELSASCTITVKPQTPIMNGDVNGDGVVSIKDVTDLINLLLTRDD